MSESIEYEKYREACRWGELHGKLQYPGIKYPTKIGVDPTKIGQRITPSQPCCEK